MAPATRSSQCMPRWITLARRAIHDAASAQPTLTGMALMLNSTPSSTKASALLSVPGAMNCGTKARKKMATLGGGLRSHQRCTVATIGCGPGQQHARAHPHEVRRANPLEYGERGGRRGQQRAHAHEHRLLVRTSNVTTTYGSAVTYDTTAQYLDSNSDAIVTLTRSGTGNNYTFNDGLGTTVNTVLKAYSGASLAS
eukprot:gene34621-42708_t